MRIRVLTTICLSLLAVACETGDGDNGQPVTLLGPTINTDARSPTSIVDLGTFDSGTVRRDAARPAVDAATQVLDSAVPDQDATPAADATPAESDTGLAPDATTDAGSVPMTDMMSGPDAGEPTDAQPLEDSGAELDQATVPDAELSVDMALIDDAEAQADMALNLDEGMGPDMHNMVDAALNDDALIEADAAQQAARTPAPEDPTLAVGPQMLAMLVSVQAIN